jgi:hypothetical protein
VQTVRPALERFYQSLSDEQKARFNAIAPADDPDAAGKDQRDLAKFCDENAPGISGGLKSGALTAGCRAALSAPICLGWSMEQILRGRSDPRDLPQCQRGSVVARLRS